MLVHVNAHKGVSKDDLKRLREFGHVHKPMVPFRAGQSLRERMRAVQDGL